MAPAAAPIPLPTVSLPTVTPPTTVPTPAPALPEVAPTANPTVTESDSVSRLREEAVVKPAPQREVRIAPSTPRPELRTFTPTVSSESPRPALDREIRALPLVAPSDLMVTQQEPSTPTEAAPAPATARSDDGTLYWVLGGGGALLVLGAAAFAMLRRRDAREDTYEEALVRTPAPAPAYPLSARPIVTATARVQATEPGLQPSPPIMATSEASMPVAEATDDRFEELEAMVAEPPSAENPFLTRSKRLRRAEYMMNHGQAPAGPAMPPETAPQAAPVAARKPAEERQREYNFGGKASYRPQAWKPATT